MTAMMTIAAAPARPQITAHTAVLVVPSPHPITPALRARPAVERDNVVHVWTGQLQVGRGDDVLTALLGSCVGIGMIWRDRGVAALAHCLLPEGDAVEAQAARYVSTAVPALLAALGARRADYPGIDVVVAGGARMLRLASGDGAIGRRNILAAQAHLAARGLNVVFEDVGGCHGRRLSIECARQRHSVVRVASDIGGRA